MESQLFRPYLVIPKLIQQPTWGGTYILELKGFMGKSFAPKVKIGQSYELFSGTKLFTALDSTAGEEYTGEIGYPDHDATDAQYFPLKAPDQYINLSELIAADPAAILGTHVLDTYGIMPLLIKINHAKGNSYQLHVRPGNPSKRWKPKAESWYYLEDGLLTYGIKSGTSIQEYKECCQRIEAYMIRLSADITNNRISRSEAVQKSTDYISAQNPRQYVNVIEAKKYDLIDLSGGGLHHSWEEDTVRYPLGNVIYEVQQDVMDPVSTVRSFDQGKIKDDGSIRTLAIEDYFAFLDSDPVHNDIQTARRRLQGTNALKTKHYAMDILSVAETIKDTTHDGFVHLYVRDGEAKVSCENGAVHMTRGTSCFIPAATNEYTIERIKNDSVILKTYIPAQE